MLVVDAHHHLWDLSAHDQPWLASDPELAPLRRNFSVADLAAAAAAEDVTATVLVQTVSEPWETPEMLATAAAGGLVAGVVGWVGLESEDVAGAIAGLRNLPGGARLAGIRHPVLVEPDSGWLARPAVLRGLAAVSAAGLAYEIVGQPRHLAAAAEAAMALPDLQFVLDHLGNPEVVPDVSAVWADALRTLAALPNVIAKLSGIFGVPAPGRDAVADADGQMDVAHMKPVYEIALDAFGPERLMFGSDWPVSTLHARYADIHAADPRSDLAVLKVSAPKRNPEPIEFRQGAQLAETMRVFILGFPFGDSLTANHGNPNITIGTGSVSSIHSVVFDFRRNRLLIAHSPFFQSDVPVIGFVILAKARD
jgi:L-fuconolactonase